MLCYKAYDPRLWPPSIGPDVLYYGLKPAWMEELELARQ
jgi:hypothetical protein